MALAPPVALGAVEAVMASDLRTPLDVGAGVLIALALAGFIFFIFALALHSQNEGDQDDAVFRTGSGRSAC